MAGREQPRGSKKYVWENPNVRRLWRLMQVHNTSSDAASAHAASTLRTSMPLAVPNEPALVATIVALPSHPPIDLHSTPHIEKEIVETYEMESTSDDGREPWRKDSSCIGESTEDDDDCHQQRGGLEAMLWPPELLHRPHRSSRGKKRRRVFGDQREDEEADDSTRRHGRLGIVLPYREAVQVDADILEPSAGHLGANDAMWFPPQVGISHELQTDLVPTDLNITEAQVRADAVHADFVHKFRIPAEIMETKVGSLEEGGIDFKPGYVGSHTMAADIIQPEMQSTDETTGERSKYCHMQGPTHGIGDVQYAIGGGGDI